MFTPKVVKPQLPKFRYYLPLTRNTYEVSHLECSWECSMNPAVYFNEPYLADVPHFESGVLLRYTGRKDIEGREVFEGDVVMFRHEGHHFTAVVVWDDDKCGFACHYNTMDDSVIKFPMPLELIIVNNYMNAPVLTVLGQIQASREERAKKAKRTKKGAK